MPAMQAVDYDPFAAQKAGPKLKPIDHDPFAQDTALRGEVEADVPGARITSTFRDQAHNRAVGGVSDSRHLSDSAADFVPPAGMTRAQAVAAIRARDPKPAELLDEGDHVHYAPSRIPQLSPVDHDPFTSVPKSGAAPQLKPVDHDPFAAKPAAAAPPADDKWDPVGDFTAPIKAAGHQVMEDARAKLKGKSTSPLGIMDIPHLAEVPLSVLQGAANVPIQAAARGIESTGVPIYKPGTLEKTQGPAARRAQIAEGLGTASFGLGPEGGEAGMTEAIAGGDAARLRTSSLPKPPTAPKAKPPSMFTAPAKAVQATFAPATVSERATDVAHYIRKAGARSQLQADRTASDLLRFDKKVARGTPEQTRALIQFMEGRTTAEVAPGEKGAFVSRPGQSAFTLSPSELKAMRAAGISTEDVKIANQIRDAYKGYRDRAEYVIARNVGAAPQFITDYYAHMWQENPDVVEQKMAGFFKQGSGENFRQRSIPTMEDGIARGLTPKYDNPIEATIVYSQNMSNFLATHDVQGWMKGQGHARWAIPGQQPEGWVPLNGILTERVPRISRKGPPVGPGGPKPADPQLRLGGPGQKALPAPEGRPGIDRDLKEYEEPPLLTGPGAGKDVVPGAAPRPGDEAIRVGGGSTAPQIEDAAAKARNVTPEPEKPKAEKEPRPDTRPRKQVLYAPEDAARVYNNWISKGLESNTAVGRGFTAARKITNATTAAKLSLSAFHGVTMAQEAAVSSVARAFQALSRGDVVTAAKGLAKAPVSMLTSGLRGRRMGQELLGLKTGSPTAEKINQAFIDSGGRIRMDKMYRTSDGRSFYDAIKAGTFRKELSGAVDKIFGADRTMMQRAKGTIDVGANLVQSIFQGPLFEDIIPAVKRGTFAERMGDFIKANPEASQKELDRFAVKLQDSVDNRFGELQQDNLFWHKQMKQVAQLLLMSPTWDIGTVREIGGGLTDMFGDSAKGVVQGKGVSDRTAYVAALLATVAVENAVMTYLKTSKGPQNLQDLEAYRTGGVDTRLGEAPERGLTPGYQKDVFAAEDAAQPGSNGPLGILRNKLSPAAGAVVDAVTNQDYAGRPIYGPGARSGAALDEAIDTLMPISVGAFAKGKQKGSNLSDLERALAVRQAPTYITNPEALANVRRKHLAREKHSADKAYERAQSRIEQ